MEDSTPGPPPELPLDILHEIYTRCDFSTKQILLEVLTNKTLQGTPTELADLHMIQSSRSEEKVFYQAIVARDSDIVSQQLQKVNKNECLVGLRLAVRYGNRRTTWLLLALSQLEKTKYNEKYQELFNMAKHQQDPADIADIAKMSNIRPGYSRTRDYPEPLGKYRTFFMDWESLFKDLIKSDKIIIQFMYRHSAADLAFALQFAGKHGYNHAAMVLLSCRELYANVGPEIKEIIAAAETLRTPTELAELARIRDSKKEEQIFYQSIIARDPKICTSLEYLDRPAQIFGLRLAMRYGSSWHVWLLLAWDQLDRIECKQLIDEAKGTLTQLELCDIAKIQHSNNLHRIIYAAILTHSYRFLKSMEDTFLKDDNVFHFGLQLAVRCGSIQVGHQLLSIGWWGRKEKNLKIGQEAAEEREEYRQHWKTIYEDGEVDCYGRPCFNPSNYY